MKDEYNEIIPANDNAPTNLFGAVTIKNDYGISDMQGTAENASAAEITDGGGKTATVSNPTASAAATTITKSSLVTNVVAVASAVIVTAAVAVTLTASAPLSTVSGVNVARYSYGNEVSVEFSLTDDDNEIEDCIVWLEPDGGEQITCTVTAEGGLYTATAALTESVNGEITMVVYACTYDGWEGELYRGALELPAAADVTAVDVWVESAYYPEDNQGAVYLGWYYTGDIENVAYYTCWLEDENGQKYEITVDDSEEYIYAEAELPVDTAPAFDNLGRLYLVIAATTNDGWTGEIYREKQLVSYSAVNGVSVTRYSYGSEISVEFSFAYGDVEIENLEVWLETYDGEQIACTVTAENGLYTATAALTESANGALIINVYAYSDDGWEGYLYYEELVLPTAANITVDGVTASYSYGVAITEFSLAYDDSEIENYVIWLENASGEQVTATITADGLYTATAAFNESTDGGLTLVIYAYTYEGWNGEIYRNAIDLPAAPEFTAESIVFSGYYDDVEGGWATISMTYAGGENITSYSYWLEDEDGQQYELEISSLDGGNITLNLSFEPETSPALDIYGRLYFVISAATDGGWEDEVYREKHILCYDGYLTYPEAYYALVSYTPNDYYLLIEASYCDTDGIWSALTLSLTDADGQVITVALDETSDNVSTETDDHYITYYYIDIYDAQITCGENGDVTVTITATWLEPDGNGGYLEEYTTVVYDSLVTVAQY